MSKTVAIFGGGIAGLTAAQELIHRGYTVHVYERQSHVGGKAASQAPANLPAPAGGRKRLPGEHGFRFFPGFYQHVIETMGEIPRPGGGFVADDLVPSINAGIAYPDTFIPFPRRFDSVTPWQLYGRLSNMFLGLGFTPLDLARMTWFRLKYLTSGPTRRMDYDQLAWTEFIELDSPLYSEACREFEISIPKTMSAMAADSSSAKVVGDISMQFLLGYGRPKNKPDRLLVGPTDEKWLDPWRAYLEGEGVVFHDEHTLEQLVYTPGSHHLDAATVSSLGVTTTVQTDYFIAALPLEQMIAQVKKAPDLAADDPELGKLLHPQAAAAISWMVGAQLYLDHDVEMVDGHVFYPKSPWALTSVSQGQFWKAHGQPPIEARYGNGSVRGIISAIISDWDTPGTTGKKARDYEDSERSDLLEEVRIQLAANAPGQFDLSKANVLHAHLDSNVQLGQGFAPPVNTSPLLIHPVGGLAHRPTTSSSIENLFLASDYVLTSTELATMEGANEAARRAVAELLRRDQSLAVLPSLYPLYEEPIFAPAKAIDERRRARNAPHILDSCPLALLADSSGLMEWAATALQSPALFEFLP